MRGNDFWIRPTHHPELIAGEVHVWRVPLEGGSARSTAAAQWTTDEGGTPSEAYSLKADRDRYATTRGVLRLLLARYLGLDLGSIILTRGSHGKPTIEVEGRIPPLFFNIAHSHDLGLIAIALEHPVGIDLEAVKAEFDWEPIARRFFADEEYTFLSSVPSDERLRAFMVLWTRKEACLKAAGLGLARGLEELEVSADEGRLPRLVHAPREMLPVSRWNLHDLSPADGYQGCLVTEEKEVRVRQWVWCDRGGVL